jgi:mannobiose 2-epimerase
MVPANFQKLFLSLLLLISIPASSYLRLDDREKIRAEMEFSLQQELLSKWYPQSMDKEHGGFFTTYTFDFKLTGEQDKMIVSQARHTWTNAMASLRYPNVDFYKAGGKWGYEFLRDFFWDKDNGGFYTLLSRQGVVKDDRKTAYGNAFGIYALAAYYKASKDTGALNLAKKAFTWLEKHSHDAVHKGYYQHLNKDGSLAKRTASTPSTSDLGYKDQNSSIHLLEAFTELYQVWPDPLLKVRLEEMLLLVRDKMVSRRGYLVLFFEPDWKPVSYQDSGAAAIQKHRSLDHVSFGHDVETAYLMAEASHTLGLKGDNATLRIGKKMVDHALRTGWDGRLGGFYDQGYYFKGAGKMSILKQSKNWWAQAEGLNTLLLMADRYPKDGQQYFEKFKTLWGYTKAYLIDHNNGDWYEEGLDNDPHRRTGLKGHAWKATYHHYRALSNCIDQLKKAG